MNRGGRWPRFTNTAPSPAAASNGALDAITCTPSRGRVLSSSSRGRSTSVSTTPSSAIQSLPGGSSTSSSHNSESVTISSRQLKLMMDQQKKLQETNERIVEMLQSQQQTNAGHKKQNIPKELSVMILKMLIICSI